MIIRADCCDEGASVRFSVIDTGIGMDVTALERLYQPFVQADASTTRRFGGTGLGLAISRQIVQMMGGELRVDSTPGHGSMFSFEIPLSTLQGPPLDPDRTPWHDMRVMLVMPDGPSRMALARQLHAWNVRLTASTQVGEAERLSRAAVDEKDPYGAVIFDPLPMFGDPSAVSMALAAIRKNVGEFIVLVANGHPDLPSISMKSGAVSDGRWSMLETPLRRADLLAALRAGVPRPRSAAPGRAAFKTSNRANRKVLLAEDNPVNQRVAVAMLETLGYHATVAKDGNEALTALAKERYDLVLMDCHMPNMDGFEAVAVWRRNEAEGAADRPLRIVAVTANAIKGERERCLAAGFDDYLSKPFTRGQLNDVLERSFESPSIDA